jgi:hypothetical protein
MITRPQKRPATASADRELAKFIEALEEFDCRGDEAQFDETVRNLTSVAWPPSDENDSAPLVPTQGDETVSRDLEEATPMPGWRIDIHRNRVEHIGIVTAPNAQEALNRAASLLHSDDAGRTAQDQVLGCPRTTR